MFSHRTGAQYDVMARTAFRLALQHQPLPSFKQFVGHHLTNLCRCRLRVLLQTGRVCTAYSSNVAFSYRERPVVVQTVAAEDVRAG